MILVHGVHRTLGVVEVWKIPYLWVMEDNSMVAVLEKASTIYKKGQTTLPLEVRNALGVSPGDSVTFRVEGDGTVLVRRTEESDEDPAIEAFLEFLAEDMQNRPHAIRALTPSLERSLRAIVAETEVDRENDEIVGDVGL